MSRGLGDVYKRQIIAIVVSSVISFLLTYATYKEDVPAVEAAK